MFYLQPQLINIYYLIWIFFLWWKKDRQRDFLNTRRFSNSFLRSKHPNPAMIWKAFIIGGFSSICLTMSLEITKMKKFNTIYECETIYIKYLLSWDIFHLPEIRQKCHAQRQEGFLQRSVTCTPFWTNYF